MTSRVAALVVLVAIVMAACSRNPAPVAQSTPSPSPVPTPGALVWSSCGSNFQCATLQVPLDYSHPTARTIGLALIRKPASVTASRIGSLVLNFGGPGESGVSDLQAFADSMTEINKRFDLVSWDTRGVGASSPMHCLSGPAEDSYLAIDGVLDDPQEKQAAIQADRDFASACQQSNGDTLPFMDTPSTARDLDMIRAAVRDDKLTYLGFSYGTYIGQNYAHLFPNHVRALSLDGVVDPSVAANDSNLAQIQGFQTNLDAFLANCRASTTCTYGRSGDPGAKLTALMNRLDTTPMAVGNRQLTRTLAMTGLAAALYDQGSWPLLDQALTAVSSGDGRILMYLADSYNGRNADGTYSSLFNGAFDSTYCLDWPVPLDIAAYDQLAQAYAKASPLFGPESQYSNLQCAYWPVKPTSHTGPIPVSGTPPILLVGGTNDPATPYVNSQSVNHQIDGSILLTRKGNGHVSYFASACSMAAENSYLNNLTLPAAGTVCTN
ncbi:MAG TPA: alpha/beta hydrolase [Candidatus Dormibacteraeota bacterium]